MKPFQTREGANKVRPGIDGRGLKCVSKRNMRLELSCLLSELKEKRYRASTGTPSGLCRTGRRRTVLLGIPTVRGNRVCNKHCVPCWNRFFDGDFHPSSYGLPPGRSAHPGDQQSARVHSALYQRPPGVVVWTCQIFGTTLDIEPDPAPVRRR